MTGNRWLQLISDNPGHSDWYIERFRTMASEGRDLHGEARFVDAMVGRQAQILDAGCGPGRLGGRLNDLGHQVVGVDLDPTLIEAARADYPMVTWLVGDLAALDELTFPAAETGDGEPGGQVGTADDGEPGGRATAFDLVVAAGNVMAFLDPDTRRAVLANLAAVLGEGGRIVVGFGAGREYEFDDYFADVAAAGLTEDLRLSTWDLRPFAPDSDFLVSVTRK